MLYKTFLIIIALFINRTFQFLQKLSVQNEKVKYLIYCGRWQDDKSAIG